MQGIYMIINLKNGKKYIGSTTNFRRRGKEHFYELGKNIHHSIILQQSWNKNNPEDYKFIILEKVEDRNILIEREQYYLDYFKSYNKKFGYNMCPVAGNPGAGKKYKHIFKFDMQGNFVEEYDNAYLAACSVGSPDSSSSITNCCLWKYRFWKNHIFSHEPTITKERIDFANNPRKATDIQKKNMSIAAINKKMRAIIQMDLDGNFIKEWPCTRDACNELSLSCGQMSDCLHGKHRQARGFKWKFKDEWIKNNEMTNEENK